MLNLLVALALVLFSFYGLRAGLRAEPGQRDTVVGFDVQTLGIAGLAVGVAIVLQGVAFGLAIIAAVSLHEFGHVVAFRICGHSDARFRLVPLLGGYAISDRLPASTEKAFFISLMGAGISVAPMVLFMIAGDQLYDRYETLGSFLWVMGVVIAALNTFNLLPFWPLDGGHLTHHLAQTFWPAGARHIAIGTSAIFAAFAVFAHSTLLLMVALLGAQSLAHTIALHEIQRPMTKRRGLLCLFAYAATLLAHGAGAFGLIQMYLG